MLRLIVCYLVLPPTPLEPYQSVLCLQQLILEANDFNAVLTLTNLNDQKPMTAVYVGLRFYDAKLNPVAAHYVNVPVANPCDSLNILMMHYLSLNDIPVLAPAPCLSVLQAVALPFKLPQPSRRVMRL